MFRHATSSRKQKTIYQAWQRNKIPASQSLDPRIVFTNTLTDSVDNLLHGIKPVFMTSYIIVLKGRAWMQKQKTFHLRWVASSNWIKIMLIVNY